MELTQDQLCILSDAIVLKMQKTRELESKALPTKKLRIAIQEEIDELNTLHKTICKHITK